MKKSMDLKVLSLLTKKQLKKQEKGRERSNPSNQEEERDYF